MTRTETARVVDDAKTELHVEAIDNGHHPHVWVDDDPHSAHSFCRDCGRSMVVRVYADGRVWKSGLKMACSVVRR